MLSFVHRAGQRCFELLALIGSPQLSFSKVFPAEQTSVDMASQESTMKDVKILQLSFVFAISFKFLRTNKKFVINRFCCFLFLIYGRKVRLLQVMCLIPKESLRSI